jgi:hypothetical protein
MILLEINAERVAFLELERNAPGAVDVNGIADGSASQRMKIETGNFHIFGTLGAIEGIQAAQTTIMHCFLNARGSAVLE